MSIKIIEYNGISGYARVMYDDVKEADKYHTEVAYDGKDVKALLEYLFELEQEIERLKNINEEHRILNGKLRKELQQKESIIKEVREYIENNKQYAELEDYGKNGEYYIDEIGLLEILDKGSEKE